MVTFTCNSCGSSLKKNKVASHLSQCNSKAFSCMDCGKDFHVNNYNSHNQCVSEDQKYGGNDYKPKESSNKGQMKQNMWIQQINETIANTKIEKPIDELMKRLLNYQNIPRKKEKFFNFVRNCLRVTNVKHIEKMWNIFDVSAQNKNNVHDKNESKSEHKNDEKNTGKRLSDNNDSVKENDKKLKSKVDDEENDDETDKHNETNESVNAVHIPMKKIIRKILKHSDDNEMTLKKLKKRVLAEYLNEGMKFSKKDVIETFYKKINNSSKFILYENKVKLNN